MRLFVVLFTLAAAAAPAVKTTSPSPRETQVVMTFDAPRALVFDALTRCELMTRWYAPTGWSLGGLVSTTSLTERDGRTTLTITLLYENAEARASDASSAEHGAPESFVRLAALLAELRKADR